MTNTREFIRKATAPGIGLSAGGLSFGPTPTKSYANMVGVNERILMTVMGPNGGCRGMFRHFGQQKNTNVIVVYIQEEMSVTNYLIPFSNS